MGKNCTVWFNAVVRGDVHHIRIGDDTNIQDGAVLHVTRKEGNPPDGWPLIIGDDVTVGHKAMLHGCSIGNRVLIGMGAIVLDGVVIEDEVLLAAGSLVSPGKRLRSGYLYRGAPATEARPLSDAERAFLKQSASNYVVLKEEYLAAAGDQRAN